MMALVLSGEGILAVKGSKLTTIFTRDIVKSCRGKDTGTHGCVMCKRRDIQVTILDDALLYIYATSTNQRHLGCTEVKP